MTLMEHKQLGSSRGDPIRVVIAEDSYVMREFLISVLEAAPEVELLEVCSDRKELDAAIETHRPGRA